MLQDVNTVTMVGRLTRDAEVKYTQGGFPIGNFSIAVNRRIKKGEQWEDRASFFDCVLFGKIAEALGQYMIKGKQVAIQGALNQDRWEQDGNTRSKVKIEVQTIQLLGGKSESSGQPSGQSAPSSYSAPPVADDFEDDSIPF